MIISFIFQVFWALIWFFLYQKKEIRLEEKASFLKNTFLISTLVAITDIIVTTILFIQSFSYFFSIRGHLFCALCTKTIYDSSKTILADPVNIICCHSHLYTNQWFK
jgi:hypothetical protein